MPDMTKTATPEQIVQIEAEESHAIHTAILSALERGRAAVWDLAEQYYELSERRGWKALGYETLRDYLGQPEVAYGESAFWALVRLHERLLVQGKLDPERVHRLEWTKANYVMKALNGGSATIENAVSDVETLSRSDLIEKYVPKQPPASLHPDGDAEGKAAITENVDGTAREDDDDPPDGTDYPDGEVAYKGVLIQKEELLRLQRWEAARDDIRAALTSGSLTVQASSLQVALATVVAAVRQLRGLRRPRG
jgi:hypothetical protein